MIHCSLYIKEYKLFQVMIKSITNFLIIFFIFQQLKSQISQIDQNGYNAFCDETLHMLVQKNLSVEYIMYKVLTLLKPFKFWCSIYSEHQKKHYFFRATLTKICPININHIWIQISYILLMKHIWKSKGLLVYLLFIKRFIGKICKLVARRLIYIAITKWKYKIEY